MKRLLAFGDSFVLGDQDDFGPDTANYNPKFPKTHNMGYDERVDYLKYNVSFVSHVAKHLNLDYINYARCGSSNYLQLDRLMMLAHNNSIRSDDIILFGLTTTSRDRISIVPRDWPNNSVNIIDPELMSKSPWTVFEYHDLFFILSTLELISQQFNVPIIKFHLFDNIFNSNVPTNIKYPHNNFLGWGYKNNTLLDILDDTWLHEIGRPIVHHSKITPKSGYEDLYTWNGHPSILGHKKIAKWFLDNVAELQQLT
jgi:hypothetical protein